MARTEYDYDSNGLARVYENSQWFLLDRNGNQVGEKYSYIEEWGEGFYKAEQGIKKNILRPDGSIVLIHKQDSVDIGEAGAFFYNGRLYCKKRSIEDGKILLLSDNEKYEPIEIENEEVIACYGKVIEIVKE